MRLIDADTLLIQRIEKAISAVDWPGVAEMAKKAKEEGLI